MNVKELQQWLNDHGANPKLVCDGIGGTKTRNAFIQVFTNKNASAVTDEYIKGIAHKLGDSDTKRIKAVAKVESAGSSFDNNGLVKILYERHYFYKFTKRVIFFPSTEDHFLSNPQAGGYTLDFNKNNVNDSWEKLSYAVCIDPFGAIQSVSIGKFQCMGIYYKQLGYKTPLDMLWAASRSESSHYDMLAGYILNVANLKGAFLKLSTNPETCRAFARGYNGSSYAKYDYHNKLAKAMR